MVDDELPIFRPRFGSRRIPPEDRGLSAAVLARLPHLGRRCPARSARRRVATRPATAQTRRVVIKARYVTLGRRGATAAALHLRYIQRDGVERDGRPGLLYGPSGQVAAATFEQPRFYEERQFRLIISPEDAGDLDLTLYVRRLMAQIERDVCQPLEWAAVNHYNTDHPHAHVVVRGVDLEGCAVRFDRDYIARGMRERAQELATQELGPRSLEDVQRARAREVTQERFTSLDRALAHYVRPDGRIERADLEVALGRRVPLLARLEHLEQMRLAERVRAGAWVLAPEWKEQLRVLGVRGDMVRQMHDAVRGDPARYRSLEPGEPLPGPVSGRVRAKVLADELRGTMCAIVEAPDGQAYRLPVDARTAEAFRVRDFVVLESAPRPRGRAEDVRIEAMAREAGGRVNPPAAAPNTPDLERRLRQIERLGLAQREGEGGWRVRVALREALDRLDLERPEHHVEVRTDPRPLDRQVTAHGPAWLDRVDPSALAPYGLGAELRPFLEQRAEQLRRWGVQPDDPQRLAKLEALERRAVGERMAASLGLELLAEPPAHFRGRVVVAPGAPGVALVSDGVRAVMLPATPDPRPHVGRLVTLAREPSGRLRVLADELDRGR